MTPMRRLSRDGSVDVVVAEDRDAAFTEYVAAKMLWLRRVAFLLCHDLDRADDLVQISITKLYVHWPRVNALANADGYARTILVNTYLAEQRSPWWKRVALGHEPGPDAAAVRDPDRDLGLDLGTALASITARQRAVLVLRFYCDLSVEETAALLGCSQGNVKSQTSRGLAAMRRVLDAPWPDGESVESSSAAHERNASVRGAVAFPEGS